MAAHDAVELVVAAHDAIEVLVAVHDAVEDGVAAHSAVIVVSQSLTVFAQLFTLFFRQILRFHKKQFDYLNLIISYKGWTVDTSRDFSFRVEPSF